jgi:hypothetical protein
MFGLVKARIEICIKTTSELDHGDEAKGTARVSSISASTEGPRTRYSANYNLGIYLPSFVERKLEL